MLCSFSLASTMYRKTNTSHTSKSSSSRASCTQTSSSHNGLASTISTPLHRDFGRSDLITICSDKALPPSANNKTAVSSCTGGSCVGISHPMAKVRLSGPSSAASERSYLSPFNICLSGAALRCHALGIDISSNLVLSALSRYALNFNLLVPTNVNNFSPFQKYCIVGIACSSCCVAKSGTSFGLQCKRITSASAGLVSTSSSQGRACLEFSSPSTNQATQTNFSCSWS
mmetsp:Transcript_137342/g.238871  ORF Transcript_137342/g.238871 Transcript_137342/m.238871 type:complete len:229 (-) Transcript_137342:241-927(-)